MFLIFANALWMSSAWLWVERENWLWIIPIALSINFLLLTYDQLLQFRMFIGNPVQGNDSWGLLKIVNELSEELNVPEPQIFLVPRHSAQIFSYAKWRGASRLYVTQGMMELLNPRQLRAVLTFQMIAIRASYNILNYWLAASLDLLRRIGKTVERAFAFVFGWTPPLAAVLLTPWLWILHLFMIGSHDFQKLDRDTAKALENPEDLALALWKMECYAQTRPWTEPWVFAHMCMVSPFTFKHRHRLLQVHPPLKSRIKSLAGRYPL